MVNKKTRNWLIALGIFLLSVFLIIQNFQYLAIKFLVHPAHVTVQDGKIYIDDGVLGDEAFHQAFIKTVNENPTIKTVVLVDLMGSINDSLNLKTCEFLYEKGLDTEVLSNSIIESGAVDLFVSGHRLKVADGAQIGVHSWADLDGNEAKDVPRSHEAHQSFLNLYRKVNIDTAFYWFTLDAAGLDDIHFMTEEEIKKYFGNKLKNK